VAFASLGFLKVRELLSRRLRLVDISYLPGPDDPVLSPKRGLLLGEATRDQVSKFDIVAFSISYENDYLHVAELLLKAGIPPMAAERNYGSYPVAGRGSGSSPAAERTTEPMVAGTERGARYPLVILGGFTMSLNPLPVADLADVVVAGEFEAVAGRLLETIGESGAGGIESGETREQMLKRLAEIEGVYIPSLGERHVKRVWCEPGAIADLAPVDSPDSDSRQSEADLINADGGRSGSHFGDMFLVETGRGCGRGCLFCAAGNVYRPVRMIETESILRSAGPSHRVGLVGTAVGDHPDLIATIDSLLNQGKSAGISSLRADQVTPGLAERLAACGIKTIAIAPETGPEDLRLRIGKRITDRQVTEAVRMLSDAGIANIKLYFMIGLPGETDRDVEAIVSLVTRLAEVRGRSRLSVAAGPFVPKPHTAFQWASFASRETLRRRGRLLKPITRLRGCSLRLGSIDEAWTEAVLARGERSISAELVEAARSGRPLKVLLRKAGYDPCRELDTANPLPWDFLDCGVGTDGLLKQYRKNKVPEL
jgi:radical SAM superfamily enzyme YgiQ (UPF0313 family)